MSPSSTAAVVAASCVAAFACMVRALAAGRSQRRVRRRVSDLAAPARAPLSVRSLAIAGAVGVGLMPLAPAIAPLGCAALVAIPMIVERNRARRGARAADAELPDVLEGVARALRGGSSLGQAVADVSPPRSVQLAREWSRLVAAVPVMGVDASARAWRDRPGSSDTAPRVLAASALCMAAEVGGPQARALDAAAVALRQAVAFDEEIRSQAAQARASAMVIGIAPLAFALLAAATDPHFLLFLLRSTLGASLLYAGVAFDLLGLAWMERLVRSVTP
jgi:tight adherence protein B